MKKIYLLIYFAAIALIAGAQQVYYVSPTGDNSDGSSWATAFTTVEAAYNAAISGDEVWIAAGTYNGISIELKDGVSLYGGFAGTETSKGARQTGEQPWEYLSQTILSGLGREFSTTASTGTSVSGNAVLKKTSTSDFTNVVIDGLTLTNGEHGIYMTSGSGVTVQYCIIRDNGELRTANNGFTTSGSLGVDGGGFCSYGANQLLYSLVEGNQAKSAGGVYQNGDGVVDGCLIRNNQALPPTNTVVYNYNSDISSGGTVWGWGGGAFIQSGIIRNCTFEGNEALAGGGLLVRDNATRVYNCIIAGNKATFGAGMTYDQRNNTANTNESVFNCLFANNQTHIFSDRMEGSYSNVDPGANGIGGAIYFHYATQKVTNCIFVGNKLVDGTPSVVGAKSTNNMGILDHCVVDNLDNVDALNSTFYVASDKILSADSYAPYDYFAGINEGAYFDAETTDIIGENRVYGDAIDIGPYEVQPYKFNVTALTGIVLDASSTASNYYPAGTAAIVKFSSPTAPFVVTEGAATQLTNTGGTNYQIDLTLSKPTSIRISPDPKWVTVVKPAQINIVSSSSVISDGKYPVVEGEDLIITFTVTEGYIPSVSAGELSVPTAAGLYTYTLRNVTADATITFTATIKTYTLTLHLSDGITEVKDINNDQPVSETSFTLTHGDALDLYFELADKYHSPHVYVNGTESALDGEELAEDIFATWDDGYELFVEATGNKDIYVVAYDENTIPVQYDLNANANTDLYGKTIRISRETYGTMAFIKFDCTQLPEEYNTIELKLKVKTPVAVPGIYPLAWIENYLGQNNGTERDPNNIVWTEDNFTYAKRPINLGEVAPRLTLTPENSEGEVVWSFTTEAVDQIKDMLSLAADEDKALSFRIDPTKIDDKSVALYVYSREGAAENPEWMPVMTFRQLNIYTVNATINATNVQVVSGEGTVEVRETYPYLLTFTVNEGYENPIVTVNGETYDAGIPANGIYTVSVSNPPLNMTIDIVASKIQYPVNATIGEGITLLSEIPATVAYGEYLPTISFSLASGYSRVLVSANGVSITPSLNAGVYTFNIPVEVYEAQNIGIYAFGSSEYPVTSDTHVRGSSTYENTVYSSATRLRTEYSTYSSPLYVYHSYLEFSVPDANTISAAETVQLRLKFSSLEKPTYPDQSIIISTIPEDNFLIESNIVNEMTWASNAEDATVIGLDLSGEVIVANTTTSGTVFNIDLDKALLASVVNDGVVRLMLTVSEFTGNDGWIEFYSMEGGDADGIPRIIVANAGSSKTVTINPVNVEILSGATTAIAGSAYSMQFKNAEGYTRPSVTVNGAAYTLAEPVNGVYTVTVSNVSDDLVINIEALPVGIHEFEVQPQLIGVKYYNLQGVEVRQPQPNNIYIVKQIYDSGLTKTGKVLMRK